MVLDYENGTSMLHDFSSHFAPLKIRKNVCLTGGKLPLFINSNGVIRLELWSYPSKAMMLCA